MNPIFLIFIVFLAKISGNEETSRAFFYLNEGDFEQAKLHFQAFQCDPHLPMQQCGDLGMAKIYLEEGRFVEAQEVLKKGEAKKLSPAALKYEWLYTQGDLYFRQNDFTASIEWLEKALPKKNEENAPWRDKTLLLLARAYLKKGELDKAKECFQQIREKHPLAIALFHLEKGEIDKETEEIYQAHALPSEKIYIKAELEARKGNRKEALSLLEKEPPHDKQLFLIGTLHFEEKNFEEAHQAYQTLLKYYPESSLIPLALYWAGRSNEKEKKKHFKELFERFPEHPLAEEAYYYYYSPQDYLLGERAAIKHLKEFKNKFPHSHLLLHAYYLEGLDALHDRRSLEGKWLSRQNLREAIESFEKVEALFAKHQDREGLLPLKHQATQERAKTHYKIALHSKPAKKAIYLDYAKHIFQLLIKDPQTEESLLEEAFYYLALTELEGGENKKALHTLDTLLSKYAEKGIKYGYFLASSLYQKGLILNNDPGLFDQALQAGQPSFLSHDEILNIMLAKAEYYRKSGALDLSMLQLSEVANYHTASSLRLKALFLRAEIYREQGRASLAEKQLESLALKGGEWGLKAKEQLDKYYGFE